VRKASKHKGPWPKLSVWHGSADRTVNPANADEIVKQWLDVHGLPPAPMSTADVDGYPRDVWWNEEGETVVESYTITNMAHGTPLGLTEGSDESYGTAGAFLIEAGISSSYHIANFFGLTEQIHQPKVNATVSAKTAKAAAKPATQATAKATEQAAPTGVPRELAGTIALTVPVPAPEPDLAKILWPRATPVYQAKPNAQRRRGIDVGAVITRALTAAGLMK
jgi:hypothetical protein